MDDCVKKKPRTLKGAVLFTVLVVMMVMIIMMLTTIALAGAASKRAYSEHFDHQTMNTARSVVDSVIQTLKSDNKELGEKIVTQLSSVGDVVTVNVNDGNNLGEGFGTVENLTFEYVGSDDEYGFNIMGTGKPIIKVTAVVDAGGEISTFSQYVIGSKTNKSSTSSGGGLIALGGYSGAESPQLTAIAPAYIGINDTLQYSNVVSFTDDFVFTSLLVNSSIELKTHPSNALSKGMGMSVMGNMFTSDGVLTFNSEFLPTDSDTITDLPYLYVDGTLYNKNGMSVGSPSNPMNIYCGRYVGPGDNALNGYANIYCYNKGNSPKPASYIYSGAGEISAENYARESWSCLGSASTSDLLAWAQSTLTTEIKRNEFKTGNFYTLGNLELNGKVKMDGDIYVDGNLHVTSLVDQAFNGNIYVKGAVTGNPDEIAKITDKLYNNTIGANTFPPTLPGSINAFLSGNLRKNELLNNTVVTTEKVRNEFYEDNGTFKEAVNASDGDISAPGYLVYKGGTSEELSATYINGAPVTDPVKLTPRGNVEGFEYDVLISNSCMLTGNFQNINFYFKPTTDIWINLENVSFEKCNIVVDDSMGSVNFYLPTDDSQLKGSATDITEYNKRIVESGYGSAYDNSFVTSSDTFIVTLDYYKNLKTQSSINFVRYPTADSDADNDWMVPDIGYYAAEGANVLIKFRGNTTLTGDICIPSGTFDADVSGLVSTTITSSTNSPTLTYEGVPMDTPVACFGSVIVDKIEKLSNEYNIYYVNYPSAAPTIPIIAGVYEWIPLEGFADF